MSDAPRKKELSPTGKLIQVIGSGVGITIAIGAMIGLGYSGMLYGALFGMVGGTIGSLVALPIAAMFPAES